MLFWLRDLFKPRDISNDLLSEATSGCAVGPGIHYRRANIVGSRAGLSRQQPTNQLLQALLLTLHVTFVNLSEYEKNSVHGPRHPPVTSLDSTGTQY